MFLPDDALSEIATRGRRALPREACGVLLPHPWQGRWIIEIENKAEKPDDSFSFTTAELRDALGQWFAEVKGHDPFDLVIWHTHPGGNVGPSRTDMQNKVKGIHHLVVAMTDAGPIPSFY